MSRIRVIDNSYTENLGGDRHDDEWSRDSYSTRHDFDHLVLVSEGDYFDLETAFEVVKGREYYLVAAIYSTGDSFGHDEGSGVEYLDLYENREDAQKAVDEILKANLRDDEKGYAYTMANGKRFKSDWAPWYDYFGGLDSIEVYNLRAE